MKSITSRLSTATFIWLPLYFIYRKKKKTTLAIFLILTVISTSCYQQYYRSNTKATTDKDMLQKLQASNKYFILHLPDRTVGLKDLAIKDSIIEADEVFLSTAHLNELNPNINKSNTVKRLNKDSVLVEVHLYTSIPQVKSGRLSLSISDINRIDVYEYDRKATRSNHALSTAGVALVSGAVIGLVALAIACNCPQVYVENNGEKQFTGGMYSGAIYSTLERTDYLPLPLVQTSDNKLKLSIANAPNEEQYINNVQLLQVSHSSNEQALLDRHGKIITYQHPVAPASAIAGTEAVQVNQLLYKDGVVYSFNNNASKHASDIILKFKKTTNNNKAKLVINGRNSLWSGYIFKEFSSLFGEGTEKWRNSQEKADPKSLEKWQKDQALPIMVYVKENDNWKFVDYFPLTGNTASRDMIMELDIDNFKEEIVEIKLETVYRFWDLDYAALDFSTGLLFKSASIAPELAVSKNGTDQRNILQNKDDKYTILKDNDAVSLEFNLPPSGNSISYFLISSGYYHNLQKYQGKMQTAELLLFRNKGGFDSFSRSKYRKVNDELAKYIVKNKGKPAK